MPRYRDGFSQQPILRSVHFFPRVRSRCPWGVCVKTRTRRLALPEKWFWPGFPLGRLRVNQMGLRRLVRVADKQQVIFSHIILLWAIAEARTCVDIPWELRLSLA